MSKITIDQVKKLREQTGAPIMECRQALRSAQGKPKKALEILKRKGMARAGRKQGRPTKAGLIEAYTHPPGKIGVLIEVGCETDFVSRNEEFKKLVHDLALQIASMNPKNVKELLEQEYIRDLKIRVKDLLKQTIGKFGENIVVRRFERFELGS